MHMYMNFEFNHPRNNMENTPTLRIYIVLNVIEKQRGRKYSLDGYRPSSSLMSPHCLLRVLQVVGERMGRMAVA